MEPSLSIPNGESGRPRWASPSCLMALAPENIRTYLMDPRVTPEITQRCEKM